MKIIQMAFVEGKEKAFTMSYDDGVLQDKRLIKLMNSYGIKGTFNLNAGLLGRIAKANIDGFDTDISTFPSLEISEIYEGHEIACHAYTHMKLTGIDSAVATYQLIEDRRCLESYTKEIITGFAYPFGVYDQTLLQVLRQTGIRYARTVESTKQFGIPEDFLRWNPTCHHNDSNLMELATDFCTQADRFGEPRLFYLWGHAYEFDQRNDWHVIEEVSKYISEYKDLIWFATNGEIESYVTAYRQLQYSVEGRYIYNPSAQDVWVKIDDIVIKVSSGQKYHTNS